MNTILYAVAGYFFLLLTVRVLVRRPGAQMTLFEFVIVFLVGGIVIAATTANDRSMTNATCTVILVGMLHRMVSAVKTKFPKIGVVIDGAPLVLRQKGEWKEEMMRRMKLAPEDVLAAGRVHGQRSLDEIEYAVLERSGEISTIAPKQK